MIVQRDSENLREDILIQISLVCWALVLPATRKHGMSAVPGAWAFPTTQTRMLPALPPISPTTPVRKRPCFCIIAPAGKVETRPRMFTPCRTATAIMIMMNIVLAGGHKEPCLNSIRGSCFYPFIYRSGIWIRILIDMGLLPDTQNCGLGMRREFRECFPRRRLQRKPLASDPGMYNGTCVTHVP